MQPNSNVDSINPKFHAKIRIPEKGRLDFFPTHLHFLNISQSSHPHSKNPNNPIPYRLKDHIRISENTASSIKPSASNSSVSPFTTKNHLVPRQNCNPSTAKQNSSSVRSTKSAFPPKPTNTVLQISSSELTGDKNKNGKTLSF